MKSSDILFLPKAPLSTDTIVNVVKQISKPSKLSFSELSYANITISIIYSNGAVYVNTAYNEKAVEVFDKFLKHGFYKKDSNDEWVVISETEYWNILWNVNKMEEVDLLTLERDDKLNIIGIK